MTLNSKPIPQTSVEVIHQLTEAQIQNLCNLYQSTWWAKGRQPEQVRQMLAHSDITVGLCNPQTRELVGFARVLTDEVYRAFLLDVIVQEALRNCGLGQRLMEAIVNHPQLQEVEAFILFCLPEMVPFYEKWGFSNELKCTQLLVRSSDQTQLALGRT